MDVLILGVCLAALLWGVGSYGLYEPHEGHFAGVGREMKLSGNWLVPHLNGSPYLNKPPLMYWSIAVGYGIFGINEWGARVPAAFYGWCAVLLAWLFAGRLWGWKAGRMAAVILTFSAGWFVFTHQVMIDAFLSTLVFASLYFFWRCVCEPERRVGWLAYYGAVALGLMAKGPVGAIFPALVAAAFILVRRRWTLLRQAGLWWGVPLLLAPVVIWAVLVEAQCRGFLGHILINEHVNRALDQRWPRDYAVSQIGALGYLGIALVWCAPWSLLLPQTARFAWRESRGAETPRREAADGVFILVLGALVSILLFLPVSARLIYYCLPSVPPFAVLVAGWWAGCGRKEAAPGRVAAALTFGLCGGVVFSAAFWMVPLLARIPDLQAAPETLALMPLMARLAGAALALAGILLWQRRPVAALLGMGLLLSVAATEVDDGFRAYEDVRSSRRLVAELAPRLGPEAVWIAEGSYELGASAGIAYYLGTDAEGHARTVRVMTDDERRPQPQFMEVARAYATNRTQLQALWDSPQAVVFVTDLMRRDFTSPAEAPRLPGGAGAPVARYGFRDVYLNPAARERLTHGSIQ